MLVQCNFTSQLTAHAHQCHIDYSVILCDCAAPVSWQLRHPDTQVIKQKTLGEKLVNAYGTQLISPSEEERSYKISK